MTKSPPLRAARALADLDTGIIIATVEVAASAERVFRALTSEEVVRWWGSPEAYRTTAYQADLRVGGRWRADGAGADGAPFFVEGEFLTVEPPYRLVHTWRPAWDPASGSTTVTYRLEPIPGGTRITLRHEGFGAHRDSCAAHTAGWESVLGWLRGFVSDGPEERHFLIRLLPPRPSFMQDMTGEERAMMGAHAAYWREHLEAGTAILFGPVADPKGGWGVGVVRARDEAAVRAFEAADPAIASGRGLRYEILPMLTAVYRS